MFWASLVVWLSRFMCLARKWAFQENIFFILHGVCLHLCLFVCVSQRERTRKGCREEVGVGKQYPRYLITLALSHYVIVNRFSNTLTHSSNSLLWKIHTCGKLLFCDIESNVHICILKNNSRLTAWYIVLKFVLVTRSKTLKINEKLFT